MAEERWHDFAKEKPSEDMEGRNFIVSNGHYEKIATWYGYWENEPFIGDRLCDEVVRWKFYFTPEEEKANEETCKEQEAIVELKAEKLSLVDKNEWQKKLNESLLFALNEAVAKQGFRNLNIPESLARLTREIADAKGENRRQQHEIA